MRHDKIQKRSFLDELYADKPRPIDPCDWPVCDNPFTLKPTAWFDDYWKAVEAVNASKTPLFIGVPRRKG